MINRPPSSRIAPSECFYRHNGNLRTTPVKLSASPKCAKNGHGDATVGRNRCSASVYASPDAFNTAKVRVHEYAHGSGCVSASALLGTGPSWRHTGYSATPVAANGNASSAAAPSGRRPVREMAHRRLAASWRDRARRVRGCDQRRDVPLAQPSLGVGRRSWSADFADCAGAPRAATARAGRPPQTPRGSRRPQGAPCRPRALRSNASAARP